MFISNIYNGLKYLLNEKWIFSEGYLEIELFSYIKTEVELISLLYLLLLLSIIYDWKHNNDNKYKNICDWNKWVILCSEKKKEHLLKQGAGWIWTLGYRLAFSATSLFTYPTVLLREIFLPTHVTVSGEKIYILTGPCMSRNIAKLIKLASSPHLHYFSGLCACVTKSK